MSTTAVHFNLLIGHKSVQSKSILNNLHQHSKNCIFFPLQFVTGKLNGIYQKNKLELHAKIEILKSPI